MGTMKSFLAGIAGVALGGPLGAIGFAYFWVWFIMPPDSDGWEGYRWIAWGFTVGSMAGIATAVRLSSDRLAALFGGVGTFLFVCWLV
jgi:hypothetical protein